MTNSRANPAARYYRGTSLDQVLLAQVVNGETLAGGQVQVMPDLPAVAGRLEQLAAKLVDGAGQVAVPERAVRQDERKQVAGWAKEEALARLEQASGQQGAKRQALAAVGRCSKDSSKNGSTWIASMRSRAT